MTKQDVVNDFINYIYYDFLKLKQGYIMRSSRSMIGIVFPMFSILHKYISHLKKLPKHGKYLFLSKKLKRETIFS